MLPPSRSSPWGGKFLAACQYLCLLLALVCLGSVAVNYGRARIFQSYQSWRFDRAVRHQTPSRFLPLLTWLGGALSILLKTPVARLNRDGLEPTPPALAGRGLVPAAHPLPPGALIGRMEIPNIGISVMVLEGDNESVLGKAVGHVPATAFPGGAGNVVVAGHRDTFFRALRDIQKDDEITFTTTEGTYHYQVESIDKVGPQDVQVLQKSSRPTLTLITCYPFYYIGPAPKRFIVQAWETQSTQMDEPNQTLANAPTSLDSHSGVLSSSAARRKETRLHPSLSPADSPAN